MYLYQHAYYFSCNIDIMSNKSSALQNEGGGGGRKKRQAGKGPALGMTPVNA